MVVGLEGLEGLVLETILSKLNPKNVAVLACVSTRFRVYADDDNLWRRFCSNDLDLSEPRDPDGNPCPTFKVTYQIWFESFAMYPLPLVKRGKQCWDAINSWMATNFPDAKETLRKGASEAELKEVEDALGVKLPIPTRVLYRFCDGQQTLSHDHWEKNRVAPLGIIGGYEFYDHRVNVHLLPLSEIIWATKEFVTQLDFLTKSKYIIVAASYCSGKLFFLNCASGQLYVGTKNVMEDGEMLPCVPLALIKLRHDVPQDALLLWLEEHSRRLQSGIIGTRELRQTRTISLYPEAPPSCSIAVSNGVQVRASAVFVPELCDLDEWKAKYFFSYSVRMSLLPEGCILDGVYFSSCQLHSRHWIIRTNDVVLSDVNGDGVIGKYPLLSPNNKEFVYESCTPLPSAPGTIEGAFTFIPGRLITPEGRQFDVKVVPVTLEVPEYIF